MGAQGERSSLIDAVRAILDAHLPAGATAIIGLSGGPDSVGLAHLVGNARPDLVLVCAHIRHGLRDDSADLAAARANAELLAAQLVVVPVTLTQGDGPEDAARRARLSALTRVAIQHDADTVLLGHTADDQAETVLLRIARGTGLNGLAGMAEVATRDGARLLRPLLGLRRADVRAFAGSCGPTAEDPTNHDPDQRRARARDEGLAAIRRLHPDEGDPVPILCRLARLARADAAALDGLADTVVLGRYGPLLFVPRNPDPTDASPTLQARVLRRAWHLLPGEPLPPPDRTIRSALDLAHGMQMHAPGGVIITASARGWVLAPSEQASLPERLLPIGGSVAIPEHQLLLTCRPVERHEPPPTTLGAHPDATHMGVMPQAQAVDPPPWQIALPLTGGPLRVGGRGGDGARDARPWLQSLVPAGARHLVPLLRGSDGVLLAVGSMAVAQPVPDQPGLLVTAAPLAGDGGHPPGHPPPSSARYPAKP